MKPEQVLKCMCYTYNSTPEGTVYTVSDRRFPEYHGVKILVFLENGINKIKYEEKKNETI